VPWKPLARRSFLQRSRRHWAISRSGSQQQRMCRCRRHWRRLLRPCTHTEAEAMALVTVAQQVGRRRRRLLNMRSPCAPLRSSIWWMCQMRRKKTFRSDRLSWALPNCSSSGRVSALCAELRRSTWRSKQLRSCFFRQCLPGTWTCDEPQNDYGVDLRDGIAEEHYLSGHVRVVQLKAAVEEASGEAVFITLNVSTLSYLRSVLEVAMVVK